MRRTLSWVLCAALFVGVGCGSDDEGSGGSGGGGQSDSGADAAAEGGQPDATTDAQSEGGDAQPEPDATPDATPDAMHDAMHDATVDATPDAPDDAAEDATADVQPDVEPDVVDSGPEPDASNRPPGQCAQSSDCSGPTATCSMAAPGGICMGCGQDSDCGNPLEYECTAVGSCRRYCNTDEDCPLGLECSANQYCKLINCSSGCPAPYVCGGSFCNRPECASTSPQCPDGMSCGQGDYCVEDSL